ncbi:MAG: DEAD/DEAH box helicase [Sphaerobacteraceae bacterium]|nr:MAG: DEAD/DEAH box helicase [Sphaerobacteraceae bacterium]
MVAAPTGTGKTVVAEFGVYESFRRGGKVMYTTPIKALSNQKFRDLRRVYGDNVGLLTGDITENPDAPIVVMTTEVIRNMLIQSPWDLDDVDCIVFDEVHYIADTERGTTWEEAIILCPAHIQLICLSATVSNAQEIADWISRTHRPIELITHYERAVPLALYYFFKRKLRLVIDHDGNKIADYDDTGGEVAKSLQRGGMNREQRMRLEQEEPQPWEIVQALRKQELLPAIYFLFSRRDCQDFAQRMALMRPNLVTDDETAEQIEEIVQTYLQSMRPEDRELDQVQIITTLARQGIGFHHAGLLPILKQFVEALFSRSLMQVVFATDTLALGVNMPARTVVIGRMSKWDGTRRRPLIPNEFQQMAGRAGRRGMDEKGSVVVPYTPWMNFGSALEIATGDLLPVRSAFAIRYNTVLNLWDPPRGDRVRHMLHQSLAQFQSARRMRELEDEIIEQTNKIDEVTQGCLIGYEAGDDLLRDYRGVNSSLTTLKNRERRIVRELSNIQMDSEERPWKEPGRQALRKLFKSLPPGQPVHARDHGWVIYLGRGNQGGVGLFLTPGGVELLTEYRQIDYMPSPALSVTLPESLVAIDEPVEDLDQVLSSSEQTDLWNELAEMDLPDLDEQMETHREKLQERFAEERSRLQEDLDDVRRSLAELEEHRKGHPCHSCDRRKEHQRNLKRVSQIKRSRVQLENRLERERQEEEARIASLIQGIRDVLHRFDYLHRGQPTSKSDTLANVFDTNGLIICEMLDRGMLNKMEPADLAEVFSWYAYDRDFRFTNKFSLPKRLILLRRRLEELEREVLGTERRNGLLISTGHSEGFYGAMRAWCHGEPMVQVLEKIELSEGDLVLAFNKTIDLMRQIREMLGQVMPDHPVRSALEQAEQIVRRDIVEQSLTAGFMPLVAEKAPDHVSAPVTEDGQDPEHDTVEVKDGM